MEPYMHDRHQLGAARQGREHDPADQRHRVAEAEQEIPVRRAQRPPSSAPSPDSAPSGAAVR